MLRVLIVDDEPLLAIALRAQLRARGYEVVGVVHDGLGAVEASRTLCPDAVLMDIRMPGIDGLEATRRIMAECPTCVIALSALAEPGAISQAVAAGARAYLMKPATIQDVVDALEGTQQECREELASRDSQAR